MSDASSSLQPASKKPRRSGSHSASSSSNSSDSDLIQGQGSQSQDATGGVGVGVGGGGAMSSSGRLQRKTSRELVDREVKMEEDDGVEDEYVCVIRLADASLPQGMSVHSSSGLSKASMDAHDLRGKNMKKQRGSSPNISSTTNSSTSNEQTSSSGLSNGTNSTHSSDTGSEDNGSSGDVDSRE